MSPNPNAWAPGQSGNPAGRPKGARNLTTRAVEALLDGEAEALTRKAIDLALEGDGPALKLCLDRLCPPRKDRVITFTMPVIEGPADYPKATEALMRAVADSEITPGEAAELSKLFDAHLKAVELADLSVRLAELEAASAAGSKP